MKLTCCAGVEAERFNRTRDHVRVKCATCGRWFCVDRKDLDAEQFTATHYYDVAGHSWDKRQRPASLRPWYCCTAHMHEAGSAAPGSTESVVTLF